MIKKNPRNEPSPEVSRPGHQAPRTRQRAAALRDLSTTNQMTQTAGRDNEPCLQQGRGCKAARKAPDRTLDSGPQTAGKNSSEAQGPGRPEPHHATGDTEERDHEEEGDHEEEAREDHEQRPRKSSSQTIGKDPQQLS